MSESVFTYHPSKSFLITTDKFGSRTRVVFNLEPNFGPHGFTCRFCDVYAKNKKMLFAVMVAQVFRSFSEDEKSEGRGDCAPVYYCVRLCDFAHAYFDLVRTASDAMWMLSTVF